MVLERIMLSDLCLAGDSRHWLLLSWWAFVIGGHLLVFRRDARVSTICSGLGRVIRVWAESVGAQS